VGLFAEACAQAGQFDHFWLSEPNREVHRQLERRFVGMNATILTSMSPAAEVPAGAVSTAVMIHVLDHLPEPHAMLRAMFAALEPGGILMVVSLALASLIAVPAAHAVCRSPKNICKHIDDCLQRASDPNKKDVEQIKEGVRTRNGKMIWVGAEACARDLGRKRQWDDWTRKCSDLEYISIAKVEMEIGKDYCDRYAE
jgi:hypothetical protein